MDENKEKIILQYDTFVKKSLESAIEEIKNILDNNRDKKIIIDFKKIKYEKSELEGIFHFLIKYKKDKIIFLRNIDDTNYSLIKYWQNRNTLENKLGKQN